MNIAILFFLCAVVCVAHSPVIVDFEPLLVGLPLAVFGLGHRLLRPLSGFFLGALFSLYSANIRLDSELPVLLEGVELQVTGTVVGLPRSTNGNIRFRFRVDNTYTLEQGSSPTPDQAFTGLVVLSCSRCPLNPVPGDEWQFLIKLSRPTGSVNPGMFDYEGWLFMQEIVGTGYVRNPDTAIFLGRNPVVELHNRLRMNIRDFIHKATINNETGISDYPGLLTALTIGDSSGISFRRLAASLQNRHQSSICHLRITCGSCCRHYLQTTGLFASANPLGWTADSTVDGLLLCTRRIRIASPASLYHDSYCCSGNIHAKANGCPGLCSAWRCSVCC